MPSRTPGRAGDGRDPRPAARARAGARRPHRRGRRRARCAESRRLHGKRSLVAGAPSTPGVYLFRDARRQVLYVGRARDLRARLRSYLAGARQRPAVEAALGALAHVEWRETGSELEAALDELQLIRELRPPANARGKGGSETWLLRRGAAWSAVSTPTAHGPILGKTLARRAARALDGHESDDPAAALPALRERLRRLAPRPAASRTRPGCATGSRRSRPWSSGSTELRAPARAPRLPARACTRARVRPGRRRRARASRDDRAPSRWAAARYRGGRCAGRRGSAAAGAVGAGGRRARRRRLVPAPPAAGAPRAPTRARRHPRRRWRGGSLRRVTQETERAARPLTAAFADRLAEAVERKRSQLCVGLDPRIDMLPVELRGESVLGRAAAASAISRFCAGIIDSVAPYVVAVKPQVAFFEVLGSDGWRALEDVCAYARKAGLLVIADAKRGDIGSTARAYASAFLEPDGTRRRLPTRSPQPVPRSRLGRAVPARLPPLRRGRVLPRPHVELGRRRDPGGHALGRHAALAAHRPPRPRVGRGSRGRARSVERRRRCRRDLPARGRRGAAGDAAGDHPAPRRRGPGSERPPTSPARSRAARRARS